MSYRCEAEKGDEENEGSEWWSICVTNGAIELEAGVGVTQQWL